MCRIVSDAFLLPLAGFKVLSQDTKARSSGGGFLSVYSWPWLTATVMRIHG